MQFRGSAPWGTRSRGAIITCKTPGAVWAPRGLAVRAGTRPAPTWRLRLGGQRNAAVPATFSGKMPALRAA